MKKQHLNIISIALYLVSIVLSIYWYDWKLITIIFIFVTANNFQLLVNKKK